MLRCMVRAVTVGVAVAALVGDAAAQEPSATVRTRQGPSYKVADASLEVFYTIGEPKEKKEEEQKFGPTINIGGGMGGPGGPADQAPGVSPGAPGGPGAEKEEKLLRGRARAAAITVWREGAEIRIAWDRIRAMLFGRNLVTSSGLPPYIPQYRYTVSVTLVDGERVEADYVNLGTAMLRGTTPNGRVEIPWEEVEHVIFER